jgi:hypothetical protein
VLKADLTYLIALKVWHTIQILIAVIGLTKYLTVMPKVIIIFYKYIYSAVNLLINNYLLIDEIYFCCIIAFLGFTCPTANQNQFFSSEARFYKSPSDCQHYYFCVENRPRLQNCGEGHAFNELIGACDAAENVTGW